LFDGYLILSPKIRDPLSRFTMNSPSLDICWRIAEAEAALAGFPVIEPAHFWIGVCKAVDLELSALLDAAAPKWKLAEERIAADLSEVKEAMAAVGISPVKLRRALRAEVGGYN